MIVLFWVAAFLAVYPYLIYPLLLWVAAKLAARPRQPGNEAVAWPTLTVIVSAHNEEAVIEQKILTTLACDYPPDKLSILVVSDASTDATNEIVNRLATEHRNVALLELVEHRGKTAGLNIAMESIETELVVFTDANALFDPMALQYLVTELRDPSVGYAVGAQLYSSDDNAAGENEGFYWRFELALKHLESRFDSVVGGDGAIYAVRRELFQPLAPEDINDFVNPLQVIAAGYRGVFCAAATAYEEPANDFAKEFRRKRRIVCRSWGALLRYTTALGLHRFPRFAFMLVSHKVIRWFTMLWIIVALSCNLALVMAGAPFFYALTLLLAILSLMGAIIGYLGARQGAVLPGLLSFPYYFYLSNLAALLGVIDYACGNRYVTWQHVRTD